MTKDKRHGNVGNQYASKGKDAKSASISIRVTQDTKDKAIADADKRNMSLADWIATIIDAQK